VRRLGQSANLLHLQVMILSDSRFMLFKQAYCTIVVSGQANLQGK